MVAVSAVGNHAVPPEPPAHHHPALTKEWREYFWGALTRTPRIPGPGRFLRSDILNTMRRLIPRDARVLEVGVGDGQLLAGLPNSVRHGIDVLPLAVELARNRDTAMQISIADAQTFTTKERYDAIICDRMCHTTADVQRILTHLSELLAPGGRLYLTYFNFLWSVPLTIGTHLGVMQRSPEQNWLSESDFRNLFTLAGLEPVHSEDRILFPADVPLVSTLLNRIGARLPGLHFASLYRTYVLRRNHTVASLPKVSVVVPTRNEAGNIERAIREVPVMGSRTELIFVEGGSTDGTYEKIASLKESYRGPLEIKLYKQEGKGKGDAVRLGFANSTGDLLMILDADLTVPPTELPKFYDAMVQGLADYAQGTRLVYPMEDEAMRFLNKLGNAFFARVFSFLLGQSIKDTLCGTKVLWRRDYQRIAQNRGFFGDFDPFGDFDLIFGAAKLNLKIIELPVRYLSRTYGQTNIQRFRDGLLLFRMSLLAARKLKFV